jgi:hypothetical protein
MHIQLTDEELMDIREALHRYAVTFVTNQKREYLNRLEIKLVEEQKYRAQRGTALGELASDAEMEYSVGDNR